ncbi:PaaI family thioesterase [Sutcliffiella horikoshii]|uniref:PaaI family thioesterase n=1 Tax=Sutcliffiella horikoshii TaxID=79883 RepID=A0A5D4T5A2_9BACI|nr:PaaI family thioesterase [Sutcliffiella horikoshii]TYS70723.1 PaaI family thioesterase [Sutcliffiella horikoshii]
MDIKQQWNHFLSDATEEEKHVASLYLKSIERIRNGSNSTHIGALMEINSEFQEPDTLTMTIPNTELLQNSLDILHGGLTATLLDSAMGTLAFKLIPEDKAAVTTEMKVNYVAKGVGDHFTCVASVIHKGTKLLVMEGKVYRSDGVLIAHATGSFFVIPKRT